MRDAECGPSTDVEELLLALLHQSSLVAAAIGAVATPDGGLVELECLCGLGISGEHCCGQIIMDSESNSKKQMQQEQKYVRRGA